jgi:2',3'-cyclic-nucleotide 2'-phosphodiesterase (5'-nucleotidase family)
MRKNVLLLLVLFFFSGCFQCSNPPESGILEKRIVVLYTNDEHGWLSESEYSEGGANLFGLWRDQEGYPEESSFLILSGGDNWTGPAVSTWFKGESMLEVMNEMGYAASAIGNHEFDFTVDVLKQRITEANFPYLSSNIRLKSTGDIPEFVTPYIIKTVAGLQVGIIGLTTRSTPWSTFPDYVRDYNFVPYADALNEIVPQVREAGADILIVIGHVCREELEDLVPLAKELDICLLTGGHCHKRYSEKIDGIVLMESGSFLTGYARAEIVYDTESEKVLSVSHRTVENQGGTPDLSVQKVVEKWEGQLDSSLSAVIGYASEEIDRNSTEMGNMVTDSWLFVYPNADISLTNRGGIRQSIPQGDITLETIVGVLPFENSILELRLTGTQLIECIGFLEVGGMTTIGGYFLADGTPIQGDSTYKVLTTDYLYARDDNLFSTYDPNPYDTSIHYRQPVIDWIQSLNSSAQNPVNNHLNNTPRR